MSKTIVYVDLLVSIRNSLGNKNRVLFDIDRHHIWLYVFVLSLSTWILKKIITKRYLFICYIAFYFIIAFFSFYSLSLFRLCIYISDFDLFNYHALKMWFILWLHCIFSYIINFCNFKEMLVDWDTAVGEKKKEKREN